MHVYCLVHPNLHPKYAKNSKPEGVVGCLLMETLEVLGRVRTDSPRVCMRPNIHTAGATKMQNKIQTQNTELKTIFLHL